MNRPPHVLARGRFWILPVLLVLLIAGHGIILYYVSSYMMLSAVVLLGAIVLVVMKHVGRRGQVHALFGRHRSRHGL
jgi:membrane protein YdbS with pleckstrin-like domain